MSLWPAGLRTGKPPAKRPPNDGWALLVFAELFPSLFGPLDSIIKRNVIREICHLHSD